MTRHDPEGVRRRILDATIEALGDVGYAATTTLEVQRRAEVSRGTLQHHFPNRPSLMAGTIRAIGARRFAGTVEAAQRRTRPQSLLEVLVALRRSFSTATYYAELELWTAARTDPLLREAIVPVEQKLGRELSMLLEDDFSSFPPERRGAAMRVAVEFMRGLASTDALRSERADHLLRREIAPLIAVLEQLERPQTNPTTQEQGNGQPTQQ